MTCTDNTTGVTEIDSLSTEFVRYPLLQPDIDPTDPAVTLHIAHTPKTDPATKPVAGDWKLGSWQEDPVGSGSWYAAVLVGPAGTVALAAGSYTGWVRPNDNPELPVIEAPGTLVVN